MFWWNSSHNAVIFKMQKRVIRIIMGYGYRESCRELFKELKILTLSSQHTFSLLLFIVNSRDHFVSNSVYHIINTRWKNDLHLPQVSLAMYQKGVYYSGIKIFNGFSKATKDISSKPKKVKIALKHYLLTHSFYSLDEFFSKQQHVTLTEFIYRIFLLCTIILNFSVLIQYPLFIYFFNLHTFVSQFVCILVSL